MKPWPESASLALIAAVERVDDDNGCRLCEDMNLVEEFGPQLSHLASQLRLLDRELQILHFCYARFREMCLYFNEVVAKSIRYNCLTPRVMTALAIYAAKTDKAGKICLSPAELLPKPNQRHNADQLNADSRPLRTEPPSFTAVRKHYNCQNYKPDP